LFDVLLIISAPSHKLEPPQNPGRSTVGEREPSIPSFSVFLTLCPLEGDVNGDSVADFLILLTNIDSHPITVADFVF
jgi:hypothetical protein